MEPPLTKFIVPVLTILNAVFAPFVENPYRFVFIVMVPLFSKVVVEPVPCTCTKSSVTAPPEEFWSSIVPLFITFPPSSKTINAPAPPYPLSVPPLLIVKIVPTPLTSMTAGVAIVPLNITG